LTTHSIDKEIASYVDNNYPQQSLAVREVSGPLIAGACQKLQEKIESILSNMEFVHKDRQKALSEMNSLMSENLKPSVKKEIIGKVSSLWSMAKKTLDKDVKKEEPSKQEEVQTFKQKVLSKYEKEVRK